ncbi:F0F1 ATP synthase subunit B [Maricaulis sp.]|uniref:F0F1 ATP synthase subunit B family protein n=1 Tax=Maricaulis sp. TaxID=1486257 RepID=UPI0026285478|nr:F0F1 ATP synthase subunit B [Maricaulis sp.]MDF1768481.1 F0F1 ATP synthase subunit B [Maricaulis sp.]
MMIRAEETGHGESQSLMEWLAAQPGDPSFFAFLALIVFFVLLLRMGVHKTIAKTLDDRADAISSELDEAKRLREEAAEMLASYQRKQREAEAEAEAIITQAKTEAKSLKAEARKEMTERLERRTAMAEQRIAQAEAQAAAEVKAAAAELAAQAAEEILKTQLRKTDLNKIVDADIKSVGEQLN